MSTDQDTGTDEKASEGESQDDSSTEKSDNQDSKQSNSGEEGADKTYKDTFGNELTADQLYDTYNKMVPNYTKISQENSEYRKAQETRDKEAGDQAREAVNKSEALKNVPPDVREAIVSIVDPVIKQAFQEREQKQSELESNQAFENEIAELETKYPGKEGMPKFDKTKVLNKMQEKGNRNYDPESTYLKMNEKEHANYLVKQALKQQRGGTKTEATGTSDQSRKPEGKTPKSFDEASNSFLSRIKGS